MANYNNSGLNKFCDTQELTKLTEDPCYLLRRNRDSTAPLKYVTYNYHPYGCTTQATCYPGQYYDDGHVSGCTIDEESALKLNIGNKLTNNNVHQELPMLPIQLPQVRGCFFVDDESSLRAQHTENWKPCTQVSERSYIPLRFQHFEQLCYDPQETEYIIEEDTFKQAFNDPRYHRAGKETRHDRLEKYRNGCNQVMFDRALSPLSTNKHYGN